MSLKLATHTSALLEAKTVEGKNFWINPKPNLQKWGGMEHNATMTKEQPCYFCAPEMSIAYAHWFFSLFLGQGRRGGLLRVSQPKNNLSVLEQFFSKISLIVDNCPYCVPMSNLDFCFCCLFSCHSRKIHLIVVSSYSITWNFFWRVRQLTSAHSKSWSSRTL